MINYLNSANPRSLVEAEISSLAYIDANGDKRASALDALLVINHLNSRLTNVGSPGEGELDILDSYFDQELLLWPLRTINKKVSASAAPFRLLQEASANRNAAITAHEQPITNLANHRKRMSYSQWHISASVQSNFNVSQAWTYKSAKQSHELSSADEASNNPPGTSLESLRQESADRFFREFF